MLTLVIIQHWINCLFGAISLSKNADVDKCKYSGYGIGFDRHGLFHNPVLELVEM